MFSDPWTLTQTTHVPAHAGFWETLFALANGFVGVRATLEFESPHAAPGTYFAGLYDRALASGTELVAAPAWLPLRFRLADAEPVHWDHVRLLGFSRSLDLRRGLLTTTARVAEGDRVTAIIWTTLVHAVELHLGMSYGTITPENYDGEIGVESWVDHRFGNGLGKTVRTNHWRSVVDSTSSPVTFEGRTAGTGHALTVASRLNVAGPSERRPLRRLGAVGEVVTAQAAPGTPVSFSRLATFAHTADGDEPPVAARLLARAEERGTASLVAAHTAEWERRWADRDVVVEGCARSQEAMRFGLFHLWQNMHPSRGCYNIAARGLTSDYHAGHFFFNTELFKLPYWALTDPGRARALVMHRVRTLPAARRLAAAAGRRGASYPEQAGCDGEPARPAPPGREKVFLSAAVSWAISAYWRATGDDDFLLDDGLEVSIEAARHGVSVLAWKAAAGAFSIENVLGSDEYHGGVTDNAFTNHLVRRSIESAGEQCRYLLARYPDRVAAVLLRTACTFAELSAWERVAPLVRAPGSIAGGVVEQFAGYGDLPDEVVTAFDANARPLLTGATAERVRSGADAQTWLIKEADVILLHALCPELYSDAQKGRDLEFYGPRTAFASSLAGSPYGVVAALADRPELAAVYYSFAARFNLDYQPRENYHNGVHLGAAAGAWQMIVQGFLGQRHLPDALVLSPRRLPPGWTAVELGLVWRGARLRVRLDREGLRLTAEGAVGTRSLATPLDETGRAASPGSLPLGEHLAVLVVP